MKSAITICGSLIIAALVNCHTVAAQTPGPAPATTPAADNRTPPFKQEELEAILAPIALFPDALLAQIFMASTYPLEIVEAARWSEAHPDVKGDAVAGAVQDQSWDPSVKSLCAFPDVLKMMNEKIDWTQKLGDAFLAQQKEVMQSVQVLRNKAKETGNLKSSKEVTVKEEPAPAGAPAPQTIIIESPDPEVIYVPSYNPTVVYGVWAYPAYPPYYYYPPYYAPGAAFWSFTAGVIVGGAIWGNCHWGGNDVYVDIDRQNNFNRNEINIDRDRNNINSNNRNSVNSNDRGGNRQSWNHDSSHRKGVGYRDTATQQKFNRGVSQESVRAREQYRGRAEQGRQQIKREGAANQRDFAGNQVSSRDAGGARGEPATISPRNTGGTDSSIRRDSASTTSNRRDTSTTTTTRRDSSSASRNSGSRSAGAFGGGSGANTRSASNRGSMSRGGGGRRR